MTDPEDMKAASQVLQALASPPDMPAHLRLRTMQGEVDVKLAPRLASLLRFAMAEVAKGNDVTVVGVDPLPKDRQE